MCLAIDVKYFLCVFYARVSNIIKSKLKIKMFILVPNDRNKTTDSKPLILIIAFGAVSPFSIAVDVDLKGLLRILILFIIRLFIISLFSFNTFSYFLYKAITIKTNRWIDLYCFIVSNFTLLSSPAFLMVVLIYAETSATVLLQLISL